MIRGAHLKRVRSALMADGSWLCYIRTDIFVFHIRYYIDCGVDAVWFTILSPRLPP
jgi:hypothetical protein